ncbi:abortive infection family protein [Paraburkholderia bannensis]|uniref:abortive infection family protein n=1 Tax=Paraburkholderia bannensis TaxID=765414 RepID=UPI002AB6D5E8|nr:abortive infection family protein [Paraburkholderia bannensis]
MRLAIPAPIISVIADIASGRETHASLDSLFMYAAAPGDPPDGSKHVKALEWLRRVNKDEAVEPLSVLGRLIESYMETPLNQWDDGSDREKIRKVLAQCKLQYVDGGGVTSAVMPLSAPSRTLEIMLSAFDYAAVDEEFNRALSNLVSEPREAVSAASNILESFCKVYIADNGLEMPAKQDLKAVWTVVRRHLGFDASLVADQELQTILTGLLAVVEGIGALRTHASSAHGAGKTAYRLEPRHARLAIHAAHTVVLFGLETWEKRRKAAPSN